MSLWLIFLSLRSLAVYFFIAFSGVPLLKKTLFAVILTFGFICHSITIFAEDYRILVLRVDFPFEDPDHYTTSGRGVFNLRDYYSDPSVNKEYTHPWDIPPHNKRYVENHLEALKNYWLTVSENSINISSEVGPV